MGAKNNYISNDRPTCYADSVGAEAIARMSGAARKAGGLFLTPVEVADFMAAGVNSRERALRILDPAAGSGTLLCAVVERLVTPSGSVRDIELTAYETDPDMQLALGAVLGVLTSWAAKRGVAVRPRIEKADFILTHAASLRTNADLFRANQVLPFDLVIANPPYFKISKGDPRAQAALSVVHGQPNIYSLFMAAGAALLREGGKFLFLVPRSFASGPYFRLFRERFFLNLRPTDVHVFGSRRDAFGGDEVLQENIILKGIRDDGWQSHRARFDLRISSSAGIGDLGHPVHRSLPIEDAIDLDGTGKVFRLPILRGEDEAVRLVDSWTGSLHQYQLNISTGPVVPFRAAEFLDERGTPPSSYAPLVWMNHVHAMRVSFPNGTKKPQFIKRTAIERSLLVPNRNYVLLRRFSAKEEARRLVAAPWLRDIFASPLLGIENHLNYIYRLRGELDEDEAYGIAALLNSELLDTYFRVSSGNTQVSATELRAMPLPPLDIIIAIGHRARSLTDAGESLDNIVNETVGASREKVR